MNRLLVIARSYRSLPLWVQVWVLLLCLVNVACVLVLDTVVGQATALAGVFVLLGNLPLMLYYQGMNRALSIPHLFAWIPLQIFLIHHLFVQQAETGMIHVYGLCVLVVNGVSLLFDVLDSWRWLAGERATPGHP